MKSVNVSELRQKLPTYLARVRKGERVVVTSRGEAIAQLVPSAAPPDLAAAARARLRGSVLRYSGPLAPAIDPAEWELNR